MYWMWIWCVVFRRRKRKNSDPVSDDRDEFSNGQPVRMKKMSRKRRSLQKRLMGSTESLGGLEELAASRASKNNNFAQWRLWLLYYLFWPLISRNIELNCANCTMLLKWFFCNLTFRLHLYLTWPEKGRLTICREIRDLKIHVYRKRLTARDHVIRARRHVCGFEVAFWTSRGGFSRKSFTSSFIALNFILCHVQILKSNKVTLFLQIG